jgi:hypothetical protein
MKNRLGIALGLAALVVAALGTTSAGQAAGDALKASVGNAGVAGPLGTQVVRRGPRGPRGRRGPRGLVGPRGPVGPAGPTGATGAQGTQGIQGLKGDKGDIGPSSARTAFRDAGVTITAGFGGAAWTTIATMSGLSPGAYAIWGKTYLDSQPIIDASGYAQCRLLAEGDLDISSANMGGQAQQVSRSALAMQVSHVFSSPGTILLQCQRGGATVTANMTKITAVLLGSVSNEPVAG